MLQFYEVFQKKRKDKGVHVVLEIAFQQSVAVESVLDRVSQGQSQIGVPPLPERKTIAWWHLKRKTVRNADQLLLVPRLPLTRRARPGVVQIIVTTITEVT